MEESPLVPLPGSADAVCWLFQQKFPAWMDHGVDSPMLPVLETLSVFIYILHLYLTIWNGHRFKKLFFIPFVLVSGGV